MNKRSGFGVMARLIGLVGPLKGWMALAILMGVAGHLCAAFITILGGYGVLTALGIATPLTLGWIFALVVVFGVLRGMLRYGEQACNHFIAFKLLALIRGKVFHALRRLCPAKLEGRDRGDLISVITSDIELLEVFYAHTISPAAIALIFSLVMVAFIGSFHWALGLLAVVAYAFVGIVIPWLTARWAGEDGLRFRTRAGELSAFVLDSLRGLSETIQYGNGKARLAQIMERTRAMGEDEGRMKATAGRNTALTNTAVLAFDLVMLFASALLFQRGEVAFAGVLIPTLALFSSFGPVIALAALGSTLQSTFAAGNRVLDILEEEPVVEEIHGKEETEFTGAAARNVTFSYGGETILDDLSLDIPHRQVVGIVGRSGSGKSTLLKLLMRFWETQEGEVTLSGRQVGEINTANLRRLEGYVTQDTHLFHDSIANNLRIARPQATQEELEEARRQASLHDFNAALPQGYDTPVGELGDTLSGGERQRLGLARAFLHDAPLLLLDEPTSNLDSLNEGVILRSLHRQRGKRTVVLVSHRPSTMGIAQRVYSVERGRVS